MLRSEKVRSGSERRQTRALTLVAAKACVVLGALGCWSAAGTALAQSHNYINYMRSGEQTSVFVQQSVDGEFGKYTLTGTNKAIVDASSAPTSTSSSAPSDGSEPNTDSKKPGPFATVQHWRGYGIGTTVGLETMKFLQFVAGHTFVNLHYRDDAVQSLTGSRLHIGGRLAFTAPLINLEGGAGVQGSRLDYTKGFEYGSFYGSGIYYSLGLNYFVSSRVSFYYEAKMTHEHLVRNSGSANVDAIDTESTLMGLGFRLWF